ncbi:MAG TPA: hypothetical protein VH599_13995 [Ktedonobacterales bacterium]|jgi:hypothetical protein
MIAEADSAAWAGEASLLWPLFALHPPPPAAETAALRVGRRDGGATGNTPACSAAVSAAQRCAQMNDALQGAVFTQTSIGRLEGGGTQAAFITL